MIGTGDEITITVVRGALAGGGGHGVLSVLVVEEFGLRGEVVEVVGRVAHGAEYLDDAVQFDGVAKVPVSLAHAVLEVVAGRLGQAVAGRPTAPLT